jgi:hypothetical protein
MKKRITLPRSLAVGAITAACLLVVSGCTKEMVEAIGPPPLDVRIAPGGHNASPSTSSPSSSSSPSPSSGHSASASAGPSR